jgi:hypothetical protein
MDSFFKRKGIGKYMTIIPVAWMLPIGDNGNAKRQAIDLIV